MVDFSYLPENTKRVLELLKNQPWMTPFCLVGGTALSLQIKHRQSEDLDFVIDTDAINLKSIIRNIAQCVKGDYKVIRQDDYQIDFLIKDVKVTFFSTESVQIPFNLKDYCQTEGFLNIANTDIIAVLKLAAIAQRNTMRDYYDLYYIAKYVIPLEEILIKSKQLLPNLAPITYTETLIYVDDISEESIQDHLSPKEIVNKYQIANFFEKEIIAIKDKI